MFDELWSEVIDRVQCRARGLQANAHCFFRLTATPSTPRLDSQTPHDHYATLEDLVTDTDDEDLHFEP